MKLKALVLALFVAGLGASFALADTGGAGGTTSASSSTATSTTATSSTEHHHGKHDGKDGKDGSACSRMELKGTFVSAGSSFFVMDVKHANHHSHALAGTQVTIGVDPETRFKRHGHATLADLRVGDRLHVHARACKGADGAAAAQLVAGKVEAHPAKAEHPKGDDDHEHTQTTTTSTTTTVK